MSKKPSNFKITHIFADGVTMTHEELLSQRVRIPYKGNEAFYEEAQRVLDPGYAEREKQRRRLERAEKRREALAAEAQRIHNELAGL